MTPLNSTLEKLKLIRMLQITAINISDHVEEALGDIDVIERKQKALHNQWKALNDHFNALGVILEKHKDAQPALISLQKHQVELLTALDALLNESTSPTVVQP